MIALNVLQAFASLYVLSISLCAINRMGPRTAHAIRMAHLVLSSGSLAALAAAFGPGNPIACAAIVGVALYLAADRRRHRKTRA